MAISKNDARKVLRVIVEYVPLKQMPFLIRDLKKIKGNSSYQATIASIEALYKIRISNETET